MTKFLCPALVIMALALSVMGEEHDHDHANEHKGHTDEVKLSAESIERYGIKVAPATKQMLSATLDVPARVTFNAEQVAHVSSTVAGRVSEIKARIGDKVKKGDELLIVESPELGEAQSDFLQKRTAVAVAASAVEPVKEAAGRARKLYDESQGIALAEVQKRQAELRVAEGALQTATAAATAAENKLHLLGLDQAAVEALATSGEISPRYAIRASIDGQVIERKATLGERVAPEKEALMILANLDPLWVIADVPEARLTDVHVGAKAIVRIAAIADKTVEGKVSFVAPMIDAGTRTAQLRIEVPNADSALMPGMFATAGLSTGNGSAESVLAIPEAAVQNVEGEPAVFVPVAGEENTFAKRAVTVGPPLGGMTPVLSGLADGEALVITGSFLLKAELGKSEAAHEH